MQRIKKIIFKLKKKQDLPLSPRLKYSGSVLAHCSLHLGDSSDSPVSASKVAEITDVRHHPWLIFVFLLEMGFHHVGQAGLKPLTSSDPLISAFQSAGIKGMSHSTRPQKIIFTPSKVGGLPYIKIFGIDTRTEHCNQTGQKRVQKQTHTYLITCDLYQK
ncbi:PREDICTED: putative uncharacterized protein encoded by LINC00269 [Colobus angolensis palliatus]|uniref:putative uncharacterized protein encoded by LINC00269 n=1 Tax=Colobus angolensis palliatus TaxID=336983 RepID=UPI0005F56248|nr:PREDICTED: putative uncharacterized protein encoded by LINC00269 [Colobus angolensis palliatus]